MTRRRLTEAEPVAPTQLALHEAAARAELLRRERARLLREINKKKLQLEQVRRQASESARDAVTRVAPLMQRHRQLLQELTRIFAEIMRAPRLTARARRELSRLRSELELRGVLAPLDDEQSENAPEALDDDEPEPARPPRGADPGRSAASSEAQVAGAAQVGQARRSLRELFRSLARAIHPDQARHESDRLQRTELMKEATRAYEDGDLARLLELESAWQSEQAVADNSDSVTRCHELERVNRELLKQVRALTRELRDTKREARDASYGLPSDELVDRATFELDALQELFGFLQRFHDGKMTLVELLERCR